jgi:uncharacterized membrane protein
MNPLEVATYATHTLFAGLWTGSVLFVTYGILPGARDGKFNAEPLQLIAGKLTTISRVSAVLLFLTGSHMAAARYTTETLTGSQPGYLVLTMLTFWLFLAATTEVATSKLTAGTERDKVRQPARNARRFFLLASFFAALLLVNAGLLSAHSAGFL